jgi:hypothetical protein
MECKKKIAKFINDLQSRGLQYREQEDLGLPFWPYLGLLPVRSTNTTTEDREALKNLLLEDEQIASQFSSGMLNQLNESVGFEIGDLADWLLVRTLDYGSAEEPLRILETFQPLNSCKAYYVYLLHGPKITKKARLSGHLSLIPYADVPDSARKKEYESKRTSLMNPADSFSQATAALIYDFTLEPVIKLSEEELAKKPENLNNLIQDTVMLLSIVGPSAISLSHHWLGYYEDFPLSHRPSVTGYSQHEIACLHPFLQLLWFFPQPDWDMAPELYEKFHSIKEDRLKDKLMLAISRIYQALRRSKTEDSAIEISVALEALLMDEERSELSYRLRTRAESFFSDNLIRRDYVAKLIKVFYSEIRSRVVHTGQLKETVRMGKQEIPAVILVRDVIITCVDISKKMIYSGKSINWSEYHLRRDDRQDLTDCSE